MTIPYTRYIPTIVFMYMAATCLEMYLVLAVPAGGSECLSTCYRPIPERKFAGWNPRHSFTCPHLGTRQEPSAHAGERLFRPMHNTCQWLSTIAALTLYIDTMSRKDRDSTKRVRQRIPSAGCRPSSYDCQNLRSPTNADPGKDATPREPYSV